MIQQLMNLGFKYNDRPFKNEKVVPMFIDEQSKIVLDIFDKETFYNKSIFKKYNKKVLDYAQIIYLRGIYESYGYSYYIITEKDIKTKLDNEQIQDLSFLNTVKYDFYIAGGWFSKKQDDTLKKLNKVIDENNYISYKPKQDGINISAIKKDRNLTKDDFLDVYIENIKSISQSKAIFASICENDSGTVYEVSIGQMLGIPVYIFDDTTDKINIMLSMNATGVFTNINDVDNFLKTGIINEGEYDSE